MATSELPPEIQAGIESAKKFFVARPFHVSPGSLVHNFNTWEHNYALWYQIAKSVLLHYKNTQGVEFTFLEIKACETDAKPSYNAYHLSFVAKPRHGVDRRPQLFFAEVYALADKNVKDFVVKICMILDPSSPDVMKGCSLCDDSVLHPRGFKFFDGPSNEE